ncbi:MAG: hypothetical protein ACJ76I_14870 [Gaiellaceae bacterium]
MKSAGLVVMLVSATAVSVAFGEVGSAPITTIAGTVNTGAAGISIQDTYPPGIAIDRHRNVFLAEPRQHRVQRISAAGRVIRFAGTGRSGCSGDGGPASSARLSGPKAIAADNLGNIYIGDYCRVRKVDARGLITTFAGGASTCCIREGVPATSQALAPHGLAVDQRGNLYISDFGSDRVRRVAVGGTITTVAGSGGSGVPGGFSGDGGPATSAKLLLPTGLAVDKAGNLYIADKGNDRVRKVNTAGTITTIAGNGGAGFSGDGGPATAAKLNHPEGVAVDQHGNVFIADTFNARIRMVTAKGVITTIAGTGVPGFSGDKGPASSAQVWYPKGIAVDAQGNLYIAEAYHVRKISLG